MRGGHRLLQQPKEIQRYKQGWHLGGGGGFGTACSIFMCQLAAGPGGCCKRNDNAELNTVLRSSQVLAKITLVGSCAPPGCTLLVDSGR